MNRSLDNLKLDWKEIHIDSVYKKGKKKLFHYTTLENVWKILTSDTLYARHVRFSNDSEEYELGKKYLEELLDRKITNIEDCYMVCFCEEKNILSQWREYARGGVSLEFDLSLTKYFTIKCNQNTIEKNLEKKFNKEEAEYNVSGTLYAPNKDYYYMYAEPIKVKYVKKKRQLKENFKDIKEITKQNSEMLEDTYLKALIPYIKHKGFQEEKEVRLIFTPLEEYSAFLVDYLNDKGFQKPYIKVEFGLAERKKERRCQICYSKLPEELFQTIKDAGHSRSYKIEIDEKKLGFDLKEENSIKENEIVISNCLGQKEMFEFLTHYVRAYNENSNIKVKIWCEGHLPIRRIIVGPAENRYEMKESIEQRLKSMFWLEYVEVDVSDIPYRQKQ